jgi:Zn finger protein HypA/HybF involved in hydrogenase expression
MPESAPQKPAWQTSVDGIHPALRDLTIAPEELEKARKNNERLQAELVELREGIGTGLSEDNKWITQQERQAESWRAQLDHWRDESIPVGQKTWTCPNGHTGTEWNAIQSFTLDTPKGRIESRHGDAACPQCGSDDLDWAGEHGRAKQIADARRGLATALYRLSRFDEAAAVVTSDTGRASPGFASLLKHIKEVAEAVYKPDEQTCNDGADYREYDKIYSPLHNAVLPVLRCPVCGNTQVVADIDTLQPAHVQLRTRGHALAQLERTAVLS